ncbi:transmembrane protein 272-like [Watersipora subatra]|uniref:transmembrane protein 272-like n=1 Tax=Watersipora subatra TaxID=2589382 RepID=UPI00355C0A35
MGKEDPPPSYDSIFKELSDKKKQSDGVVDYTKEAAEVVNTRMSGAIGLCICGIFCSLLSIALPVTEIVIGSLYLGQCSAQYLLPIYLIVSGVFGVATGSCGSVQRIANRNNKQTEDSESGEQKSGTKSKASGGFSSIFGLFTFAWLICGSVWAFQMQECTSTAGLMINSTDVSCFTKDAEFAASSFYCHSLLYDFAYYETIAKWAVMAAMLFIVSMVCCCICCVFCCKSSSKQDATEMQ